MIDNIIVSPVAHLTVGTLVLVANFVFLLIVGRLAWQKRAISSVGNLAFIVFQATLMVQVLVGIKLLDQGLGVLQLYIHYLGGAASLAFCLIFYWLPTKDATAKSRRLAGVAAMSFFFVLLTFAVGGMANVGPDAAEIESSAEITQIDNRVGDPVRGKTLYDAYGAGAHGINGAGVSGLGTALSTSPFIANQSDAQLVAFLKTGRGLNAPDNLSGVSMPSNGSIPNATDQDLLDVVAYLRTLNE